MLDAFLSSWKYIFFWKNIAKFSYIKLKIHFLNQIPANIPYIKLKIYFLKQMLAALLFVKLKKYFLKQIPAVVHIKLWIYFIKQILAARRPFWANNSSADFPPGQDAALKKLRTQDLCFSIINGSWHIKPFEVDFVHKRYMLEDKAVILKANCWHLWQICD